MSKTDREIVAVATPGPWIKDDWGYVHVYDAENDEYIYIAETYSDEWTHFDEKVRESNAQFIAHFNPSKITELLDTIDAQARRIEGLEVENERLRNLVSELVDDDPCWYDHHGYCQAHSLHEKPCPHERAKETIK